MAESGLNDKLTGKRERGKPLELFRPYKPSVARWLAHRAYEVTQEPGFTFSRGASHCKVCNHPDREEIDYLILINEKIEVRKAAMGESGAKMTHARFRIHRDWHLLKLISRQVVPSIDNLKRIPFPVNGDEHTRLLWFVEQTYGIYLDALDRGYGQRALSALGSLYNWSEKLARPMEKPVEIPALARDLEEKPVTSTAKLQLAIARSAPSRKVHAEEES